MNFEDFDSVAAGEDTLGGTPRFPGTRVSVYALVDYLATGHTVEDFLDQYRLEKGPVLEFLGELRAALRPHAEPENNVYPRD
jgi:uncharacterized protein (DUF433 family)